MRRSNSVGKAVAFRVAGRAQDGVLKVSVSLGTLRNRIDRGIQRERASTVGDAGCRTAG